MDRLIQSIVIICESLGCRQLLAGRGFGSTTHKVYEIRQVRRKLRVRQSHVVLGRWIKLLRALVNYGDSGFQVGSNWVANVPEDVLCICAVGI